MRANRQTSASRAAFDAATSPPARSAAPSAPGSAPADRQPPWSSTNDPGVHDQVPPGAPDHDEDEPAAPTATFTIWPISRMRSAVVPRFVLRAEHLQHGLGAISRAAAVAPCRRASSGDRLVQRVQPVALAARVEVGDERAEHVADGGEEQHEGLGDADRRRVHRELRRAPWGDADSTNSRPRTAAGTAARPAPSVLRSG